MKIYNFSLNIQKITDETDVEKIIESIIDNELSQFQDIDREDLKQTIVLIAERDVMDGEQPYLEKDKIYVSDFFGRHGLFVEALEVEDNPWVTEENLKELPEGDFRHYKIVISNRSGKSCHIYTTTTPDPDPILILEYCSVMFKFYEICEQDFYEWYKYVGSSDEEKAEHRFEWIRSNSKDLMKFFGQEWYREFVYGTDTTCHWPRY